MFYLLHVYMTSFVELPNKAVRVENSCIQGVELSLKTRWLSFDHLLRRFVMTTIHWESGLICLAFAARIVRHSQWVSYYNILWQLSMDEKEWVRFCLFSRYQFKGSNFQIFLRIFIIFCLAVFVFLSDEFCTLFVVSLLYNLRANIALAI